MSAEFIHLHVHSEYSLVDSTLRMPDKPEYGDPAKAKRPNLISRAVQMGLPALALTDESNLFALVKFYRAAEANGVPTLKLKLIATALSGGFMGMAGAPLPYYVTYLDPASGFSLSYAVNTIAMPLIGGTGSWLGPVLGAVLLGTLQQVATVTISSALSLLLVGVLLVCFVVAAPRGIIGWFTG